LAVFLDTEKPSFYLRSGDIFRTRLQPDGAYKVIRDTVNQAKT
jgi:hypothetical protein